jgi:hypothetical protein
MSQPAWTFQHSIECNTSRGFAWAYWTDIANWSDGPAKFELDGPFDVGSQLTTTLPGQTLHSVIRHVDPGRRATIEMQLPDCTLFFNWEFEELAAARTRITQRLVLSAASADLVSQARLLEQTVPQGMSTLIAAIEEASKGSRNQAI